MHLKLKRTPGLYLAGFMGSGKTTIAKILSDHVGWDYVDVDAEIEKAEGITIAQIFDTRGEAEFRRIETETIKKLVRKIECGMPMVIALGGGAFVQPGNFELMENNGLSIWLDCPFEVILQRLGDTDNRPLARDLDGLRALYESRREGYSKADFHIDAACDPQTSVTKILELNIWR